MEQSGRNQGQPSANRASRENGSNKPNPLPAVADSCGHNEMVRRGVDREHRGRRADHNTGHDPQSARLGLALSPAKRERD